MSNNSIDNTNLSDFSVVNAYQDSDNSSGSSYYTEDELSDPDDKDNHELDAKTALRE